MRTGTTEDMIGGIVKFFNPEKFYGFIEPIHGGKDVFVYADAYCGFAEWNRVDGKLIPTRMPKKGDNVMFLRDDFEPKGPVAYSYMFLDEHQESMKPRLPIEEVFAKALRGEGCKDIKEKVLFMGINIFSPDSSPIAFIDKYAIVAQKKLIKGISLEDSVAKVAWSAVNVEKMDQDEVMQELREAIARHDLDADIVIETAGELDEDTVKNYEDLSSIF